jgi:hypothetical protein
MPLLAQQPSTIVVEQPPVTVVEEGANPPSATPDIGTDVPFLPSGSQSKNIDGTILYENKGTWYKPYVGTNGTYYEVVSQPATGN